MKKKLFATFLVIVLTSLLCLGASAESNTKVVDYADILTDSEESKLQSKLDALTDEYGFDVAVVTVDSLGTSSARSRAELEYNQNGYGDDGVLLLLSIEYGDWYIATTGEGREIIEDSDVDSIGSALADDYRAGDYYSMFETFIEECDYYADNHFSFGFGKHLVIALVIGFVVAFIATGVMKGKLKSVRFNNTATDYVKSGSMKVETSRDIYLYRNITRVPKPKSSSSGSSGGSGGRSFGGGGGRF